MKSIDLIQHRDGVEIPASGEWLIAPGQYLIAARWRHVGLKMLCLRTTSGVLRISTNPPVVTFELELAPGNAYSAPTIVYVGELVAANHYGWWQLRGTVRTNGSAPRPLDVEAIYQGVYRHGARPVTLLTITGAFASPTCWHIPDWQVPHKPLMFHGDLNAHQGQTSAELAALWGPNEGHKIPAS